MASSTGTITTSAGPLDVATLVDKLIAAEGKQRLTSLANKASSFNALISAYGNLKGAMTTYQSALKGLNVASFSAQKPTVSNAGSGTNLTTDPFTADVNTDETTKALAQKLKSIGFTPGNTFQAGDTIAIKVGTEQPKFITLKANATLAGVRDAINAGKADVTASIVTDASGDHLVLESNKGGTANTLKITGNGSLADIRYDASSNAPGGMTQVQAPRDATKAASGKYSIAVSQLAQSHKVTSAPISPGMTFESGVLAIKTGNGSTALIHPKSNTLAGVRDAINASDAGVTAAIVSDGANNHLVLTTKDSGAANSLRVSGTGNFAVFNFDPSGTVMSPNVPTGQTFSAGSLSLQVGAKTFAINPAGTALSDVVQAINGAAAGVTASITSANGQDRLVLTPAGSDTVALTGSSDYAALSASGMGQLSKAQDAKLTIDGVTVTSATNKVSDAISGVTLNLTKVTTAADNFSLTIANDTSGVATAANTFVSAYNTLAKAIASLTKQTPSTTKGQANTNSPLASESSVKNIMTQLRGVLMSSMSDAGGATSLSQIGISFQKDGTLALDATKLNNATTKNFEGVAKLFGGTDGVVPKLQKLMDTMLGDKGVLADKTKGLQDSLKNNTDLQTAANARLVNLKDAYTNQFNRLNITLATMQSRQSYLTQQLAKLSGK
ncbi:flagellar filament capping protein FliD [Herbaspirillum sp. LeCh32-8]|uniref:flagellar filament capping protein FliD n=1 Tax=Herbaspirillum sp. LeCh32-8 TaxID=2821356 RepID=UPI001AE15631|nr:flagellar filament capping protein FliD [Herbaspirillum sp. LeCh32-8]MBP0600431.1 flagellar filament capping protein FliD [Herbaspirillum sp. LeCh32-8]